MDYTISDAYMTHAATGYRMHQDSSPIPTLVSADDMNQVAWSLMDLIKAAGLSGQEFDPDAATSYQQVTSAVRRMAGVVTIWPVSAAQNSAVLSVAIDLVQAVHGGTVQMAPGDWSMNTTVTKTLLYATRIVLMPGAVVRKMKDGDWLSLTLTGSGRIHFDGHGEIYSDWAGSSASAAAIRVVGSDMARAVTSAGGNRISFGMGVWKYALHLTDIGDPDLGGLIVVGDGLQTSGSTNVDGNMIGLLITTAARKSVSWSIHQLDVYNCVLAIHAINTRAPGIEGLKLVDCDLVGGKHGLLFENNSVYSPPQIELIGTHINSYNTCLKVTKALKVSITGGMLYRYGRQVSGSVVSEGAFVEIDGVQDFSIAGGTELSIVGAGVNVPGIIASSTSQASAFVRLNDMHFWANGRSSPVLKLQGTINDVVIGGGCTKDTLGKWIDKTALTSSVGQIRLSRELRVVSVDYPDTVMTDCPYVAGAVDVSAALWGRVNITGASAGNVVSSITGWLPGRQYMIKCEVAGVVVQHNATINLRSGANFTFGAGDTITVEAEQALVRESARRAT